MATLIKNGHSVTTSYAPEINSLRAQGYTEAPATKQVAEPTDTQDSPAAKPAPKTSK